MAEVLFAVFWLTVFLVLWAVIGHGLWVFAAACLRAIFANPHTPVRCPQCGRLSLVQGRCTHCSQPPVTAPAPVKTDDREAVSRHLQDLLQRGQIAPEEHRELRSILQLPPLPVEQFVDAEIVYLDRAEQTPFAPSQPAVALPASPPAGGPGMQLSPQKVAEKPVPPPRHAHPLDRESRPTVAPIPAATPARPLAEVLQAFLEEKNIRWGEILAGLFIVISAVGLIISLRNTLKAIPYFPALMFMVFTLLFHGAGLYSLRKWNLHAVSRVVLVISLLLVPLSCGAGIVLSGTGEARRPLSDPWVFTAILVGIGAFAWVSWSAAKELVDRAAWQISVVVMGTAIGQILINRWPVETHAGWAIIGLATVPLISFLVPLAAAIAWNLPARQLTRRRANRLLLITGVGFFALLVPLALLFANVDDRRRAWADLSPLLSLAAVAVIAVGLVLQRKAISRSLAAWQTAGTSIAILFTLVLLALLAVAWPRPELLIAVGLLDGALLIALAIAIDIPFLHAAGIAALTIAWLVGSTWLRGAWPPDEPVTSQALLSGLAAIHSGVAVTIWNAVVLGAAVYLRRFGPHHALSRAVPRVYLLGAAGVGVLSLVVTVHAAFAPWMPANPWPMAASAIFAIYAVAILLTAKRLPHPALSAVAAGVAWLACVHLLARNEIVRGWLGLESDTNVLRLPTLVHACLMAIASSLLARNTWLVDSEVFTLRCETLRSRVFVLPVILAALTSSVLGALFEFLPWTPDFSRHAAAVAAIAAVWLLVTFVTRRAAGVTATQLAIHAAVALAIAGRWSGSADEPQWYWQAGHLAAQLFAAATLAALGAALRLSTERLPAVHHLFRDAVPELDELVLPAALVGLLVVIGGGLGPAIGLELGWLPTEFATNDWTGIVRQGLAWGAIAVILVGYGLRLYERFTADAIAGILLALALIPALAAGAWHNDAAAASALRWGLAIFGLLSAAIIAARQQLLSLAARVPRWQSASLGDREIEQLRYFCLVIAAGPILAITCVAVGTSLAGTELGGPLPESLFGQLGLSISYGVPLLAVVASLLLYSLRERESKFALAGSIVFQGAVNLALLLYLKDAGFQYLREAAALSLQINALGSAGYLILWLGLDHWIKPDLAARSRFPRSVDWAIFFLTRLVIVTALWAVAAIVVSPAWQAPWDARLANPLSFIALGLNALIIAWRYGRQRMWHAVQGAFALLLSLAALLALAFDCAEPAATWRGFVVLESSWLGLGILATLLAWWTARRQSPEADPIFSTLPRTLARRGIIVTALAAALAVYGGWDSPWHPWYSLALIAVAQLCFLGQGALLQHRWIGYLALPLAMATGIVVWGDPVFPRLTPSLWTGIQLIDVVGLSVVGVSLAWLGLEIWLQRRTTESPQQGFSFPPMPRVASLLLVLGTVAACGLAWAGIPFPKADVVVWILRSETTAFVVSTGIVLAASLWDRRAVATLPLAYVWGLAATLHVVAAVNPRFEWALVATLLAIATYLALTAHGWKWGADLAGLGLRLGIHDPVAGLVRVSWWLPSTNLVACGGLAIASVVLVLTLPFRDARMATAVAPLLVAWCVSSLAQERRKEPLLVVAYLAAVLAAVCLGWADLGPSHDALSWLIRTIRLLMALCFATLLYGLVLPRWFFPAGDWHVAARRAAGLTAMTAMLTLLAVLAQETAVFEPGVGVPLDGALIVAVSVVLAALVVGLISLALLPGSDPLQLNEEGRAWYVYAAQVVAALLFVHLYLVRPHFFDVTLRPYWPYILVGLAFASVGIGELFQRSGVRVLGQPLQRSGGLLPLLPALGMWFLASEADNSLVLFLVGLVFLLYSWLRQSLAGGLAAAAAGNAALWVWLARDEGRSFFNHPQLWLIPPAVSVLLAAHLQRRRLPANMLAGIRYTATLVIYLSSTSEMFIQGIGRQLWPPMILALLGVAGAVAGVVLQVRAFLYLGVGFVLLALISMVAHAAQAIDHVWPWWAFGIGVGLAILVFLGLFEKKRPEITGLIQRLRSWG